MNRIFTIASIIAVGLAIGIFARAYSHSSIEATATSVILKAMARGYECREAGRALQDCQDEQQRIWKKVENGASADQILPFGKN